MSSRAVILPHFGDPLTLHYLLDWFEKVWWQEIDALYVVSSNILDDECAQFIADELDRVRESTGVKISYFLSKPPIQHGDAINQALDVVKEDLVMLLEEDTVIFNAGQIERCFSKIEAGTVDAVGSSRGSCADLITEQCRLIFGDLPYRPGSRDMCYNFWPNFFFCKKEDLLRTDRNFNAKGWDKGVSIPELDIMSVPETMAGDTFVWASIQLRLLGLRFGYVEQFHGSPDDMSDFNNKENVFNGQASWVHHGSLSGWKSLFNDPVQVVQGVAQGEMARRMQWYRTFAQDFVIHNPDKLILLVEDYLAGIHRTMDAYGITENQLDKRQLIYNTLFEGKL